MRIRRWTWLLKGFRNIPAVDLGLLEELLVCLSNLLVDFPEISELDMNPVLVKTDQPMAVDARVLVRGSETKSPHHLVISPYPEHYESLEKTEDGVDIFIRPIKPEDAPLLLNLFENLSFESRYNRFFSPMKTLPYDMLIRLTQIDYDRHIALVGMLPNGGKEEIVAVARVIIGSDLGRTEFSVVVGDPWQGKGIGPKLLEKCLDASRDYGVKTVFGSVLAENTHMLDLAREMGFKVSRGPEARTFEVSLQL